jgi:hypothetical protein
MSPRRQAVPLVLAIAGWALACAGDSKRGATAGVSRTDTAIAADTAPPSETVNRARAAADALGKELQAKLLAALGSGGPSRAVAYCADSAQVLSARHAREGIYLRRVSLRVRNPANRPDAAEERLLRELDSLHRARALPGEVVQIGRSPNGERLVEYARPILVQERCLACHGEPERLAPGVREILTTRYPVDQATGYRSGDLRGMISVRVRQ